MNNQQSRRLLSKTFGLAIATASLIIGVPTSAQPQVTPSPSPTRTPGATPGTPSPSPTRTPGATPGTPSPSPTPTPGATPGTPSPSPTPTPGAGTPSPSPTPTPGAGTPSPSPTPTPGSTQGTTSGTIVDVASADSSLKTLVTAVKAADLANTLTGKGPFTVFAPTDAAFAALPKGTVEKLLEPENKAILQKILTYHVVPNAIYSNTLQPTQQVKTVEGSPVSIKLEKNGKVTVDQATVTKADIKATNGVIHVIDQLIIPADLLK
ncbi:MAG: fasciclin domain-containing protein [Mojavia pulchra JT2-VF2]|jgi:uncharacterized surface protein with fasciclin (FAS1) repeats|uniref:Fasciclin domain-containing protein n=1 Tax=Mojavia pulchra JT2-VF2 TaxID=287848 RepID=A0A951UIJ2_9NOST|nr:fasciclin domain-containing protein [Mojavia pulchra JT2-VF2]